jgi:hypothetical protein
MQYSAERKKESRKERTRERASEPKKEGQSFHFPQAPPEQRVIRTISVAGSSSSNFHHSRQDC